jgi:two-component system response regulator HydG
MCRTEIMNPKILIVDDERSMCDLLETDLRLRDFAPQCFTSAQDAFDAFCREDFEVVLTDLKMPGMDGIEFCSRLAANRPDVPVIVMTAFGSLDTAIAAIRAGAYDFVTKPIELELLAVILRRAVERRRLQEQVRSLRETVERAERFEQLLGQSAPMQRLYDQLAQIADTEASVLITGESGTGKELVAKALHQRSRRASKPFVAVNCAALPDTLLESELFGHVKGAFTDARADRKGLFLQAEGGTLLLDEIGEMPLTMQPKLLRALEESRIRPVGSEKEVVFDVRILAATNRDLETAVEERRFREDLFFRINVIQVELPPLRARGADALLLAQHFIEIFCARAQKEVRGMSEAVAEKLLAYCWPGNVRELRNVIERAVALTRFDKLTVEDLPEKVRDYRSSQVVLGGNDPGELVPLEEVERRYILHVLDSVGGNRTLAARTLGLDRKTLYRKLRQYGVVSGEGE